MTQLDKAKREIALTTIDIDFPKIGGNSFTRRACTTEKPMPLYLYHGTGTGIGY